MTKVNSPSQLWRKFSDSAHGVATLALLFSAIFVSATESLAQSTPDVPPTAAIDGSILPFPPTPSASTAGLTFQDSIYKKRVEPKRLAADAPNILIILMDDVGPATPSTYGGEINTPTLDRVSKMGVSFSRFHLSVFR